MTKKTLLTLSSYINLFLLAYMAYATYTTQATLNAGGKVHGVGAAFSMLNPQMIMLVLVGATAYITFALLVKLFGAKVEKNGLTSLIMIIDVVMIVFFVIASGNAFQSVIAGKILGNVTEIGLVGASFLALLIDLVSLPTERWGDYN